MSNLLVCEFHTRCSLQSQSCFYNDPIQEDLFTAILNGTDHLDNLDFLFFHICGLFESSWEDRLRKAETKKI